MNVNIDDDIMLALVDLAQVDGVTTTDRVDAILRHYLTDLHSKIAPAAASVAAVVTGQGLHRETLTGPLWPCVLCGAAEGTPCDAYVHGLATSVAEHAVEHRDEPTSGFEHLPEVPGSGTDDRTGDGDAPEQTASGQDATTGADSATPQPAPTEGAKGKWVCCGQAFRNPQAMGAHRRYEHADGAGLARGGDRKSTKAKTTAKRTPPRTVKFKVGGCTRCRRPSARLTPVPDVGDLCTVCVKDLA